MAVAQLTVYSLEASVDNLVKQLFSTEKTLKQHQMEQIEFEQRAEGVYAGEFSF